ncbi:hypothetical protein Ancab_033845 [Ancistrocladus abbreviatus]
MGVILDYELFCGLTETASDGFLLISGVSHRTYRRFCHHIILALVSLSSSLLLGMDRLSFSEMYHTNLQQIAEGY